MKTKHSIQAPPYSYSMDIMEISTNIYVLIIIEQTSRKIYTYHLKNKKADDAYKAFRVFLDEVLGKINNVTSTTKREYKKIWEKNKDIRFFRVADDNYGALSILDRGKRTLKMMIKEYISEYNDSEYNEMLSELTNLYNNTNHLSLFTINPRTKRKEYYTPNQVWMSPAISNIIRTNKQRYLSNNVIFKKGRKWIYKRN